VATDVLILDNVVLITVSQYGLTRNQLRNALQAGHRGNLRDKAIRSAET
jgi:hypothetical protein